MRPAVVGGGVDARAVAVLEVKVRKAAVDHEQRVLVGRIRKPHLREDQPVVNGAVEHGVALHGHNRVR